MQRSGIGLTSDYFHDGRERQGTRCDAARRNLEIHQTIPRDQTEAAKAIGLPFFGVLAYVRLPQMLRGLLPRWINTRVEMVSLIAFPRGTRDD